MREELAKLVRRVTVTRLRQEEMKTVIRTRFPKLEDLTEKIMRIISPKDHNHYPYQVKLVNTLRSSRQLKWCMRKPTSQQLAEVLFQDAVNIFCRLSQKYPHPQASHLPHVIWSPGWKSVCPPVILSPILPPLHSEFSVTRHTSTLLELVAMAATSMEPVLLLVGKTGVGKTTSDQFLAEKTGRNLKVINNNHTAHITHSRWG